MLDTYKHARSIDRYFIRDSFPPMNLNGQKTLGRGREKEEKESHLGQSARGKKNENEREKKKKKKELFYGSLCISISKEKLKQMPS